MVSQVGSCQKKVQRDFEKPSFEEKTRFHPHILENRDGRESEFPPTNCKTHAPLITIHSPLCFLLLPAFDQSGIGIPSYHLQNSRFTHHYPLTTVFPYFLPSTSESTTPGSASVEVSPRSEISPSAILRRTRLIILPERVLGSAGVNWILSGEACGPIC